jgi:hypothetical protein
MVSLTEVPSAVVTVPKDHEMCELHKKGRELLFV